MSKYVYEVYGLKDEYTVETVGQTQRTSRRDTDTIETFIFDEKTGKFVSTGYKYMKNVYSGTYARMGGEIVRVINVANPDGGSWS